MSFRTNLFNILCALHPVIHTGAYADDLIYRYEGDVLADAVPAEWAGYQQCVAPCAQRLEDGHLIMEWTRPVLVNLNHVVARSPTPPPEPMGRMALLVQLRRSAGFLRL